MTVSSNLNEILPKTERDKLRREALFKLGGPYSPLGHLAITSVFGLSLMLAGAFLLKDVTWWQVAFALGMFVFSNAAEWRIHRSVLHKRFPFAAVLYDRHTPEHHLIFVTDDMSIRSRAEFRLVLIPAYGIVLIFVGLSPLMALVWVLGQHNLAAIFAIISMGYVVSYEWLHLSYHLPADSWIGRRGLIRWLRQHHANHHDPRLMQRWNFNVTVPLWDWVRGTYMSSREEALAIEAARRLNPRAASAGVTE